MAMTGRGYLSSLPQPPCNVCLAQSNTLVDVLHVKGNDPPVYKNLLKLQSRMTNKDNNNNNHDVEGVLLLI